MGGMVKGLDLLVMYYYMVGFYKNLSVALRKKGDLLNFIILRDKQVSGKATLIWESLHQQRCCSLFLLV